MLFKLFHCTLRCLTLPEIRLSVDPLGRTHPAHGAGAGRAGQEASPQGGGRRRGVRQEPHVGRGPQLQALLQVPAEPPARDHLHVAGHRRLADSDIAAFPRLNISISDPDDGHCRAAEAAVHSLGARSLYLRTPSATSARSRQPGLPPPGPTSASAGSAPALLPGAGAGATTALAAE
jgi:hypothetical protein